MGQKIWIPIKMAHDGMCGYVKGLEAGTFEAMDQTNLAFIQFWGIYHIYLIIR